MEREHTSMGSEDMLINVGDQVLVTGAAGFIGVRVVESLLNQGFRKVRCVVRPTSNRKRLDEIISTHHAAAQTEVMVGNLLSREDCLSATRDVKVIYHLAAGTGTKSFADAFLNSVVTTRNLLDATLQHKCLKRFASLSSFAVYTNRGKPRWRRLDETCPVEEHPESRAEAYGYGKVKQDELVKEYGQEHRVPYVILRPGVVYGPGKHAITGRVGIDTFGLFLHLGGSNRIPFTFVDNCANAIVLAGLKKGIDGEVFNIVDDDLPTSRKFLRLYKRHVKEFKSVYVPHCLSYLFCFIWEKYSLWSEEQLPPVFTRREWSASWKRTHYSNEKLKMMLGWVPKITTTEGLQMFFEYCRERKRSA